MGNLGFNIISVFPGIRLTPISSQPNGLRYRRWGECGFCLEAEKTRSEENAQKRRRIPAVQCMPCQAELLRPTVKGLPNHPARVPCERPRPVWLAVHVLIERNPGAVWIRYVSVANARWTHGRILDDRDASSA
jgi:hypothetical protein